MMEGLEHVIAKAKKDENMKILTVVGARPQFIKAASVSRVLRTQYAEVLIHTGQHYDRQMSDVFFDELEISRPNHNLNVGSAKHGAQTGEMLIRLEPIFEQEKPDCVLVYGDTNSTLAGALAATKLHIPVAHVEAGLRSFNRAMPEEINRILTDHVSDLLFCPSQQPVRQLEIEGITKGVYVVGDVMYDSVLQYIGIAERKSHILSALDLESKKYLLATLHRPVNVDDTNRLFYLLETFNQIGETVVFPVHPRTRKAIQSTRFIMSKNIRLIEPLGYLDMLWLEKNARMILTDSGGVQKESYWMNIPCVTLREETEWVETVQVGWNVLVGADREKIFAATRGFIPPAVHPFLFGDGNASVRIAQHLTEFFRKL